MSETKEYYSKQLETGSLHISEDVVCAIAAAAVTEVEGVVALNSNFGAEIQDRLTKKATGRGVRLTAKDDAVCVECSVMVQYGYSMQTIGQNIQAAVCQALESMAGLKVLNVNVNIAGISMTK
ncbi:MAG: Asp23/Gls24 family envelope stress response protein [Ruminococcaceae bacterium]|nr:Asp23/Gls24 family envelope stress response protein [Oscillospiraceae bacterium]